LSLGSSYPEPPSERWVVLDGRREPRCVIETTQINYWRFHEVDAALAYEEGEGDRSLAYWRNAHRTYFERLGCLLIDG
jgi:uncharacterized protein YhfF